MAMYGDRLSQTYTNVLLFELDRVSRMLELCFKLHFSNEYPLKEKTVVLKLDTCMINENYKKKIRVVRFKRY